MSREFQVMERCQDVLPEWRGLGMADFEFAAPKGFSSFTMGVTCKTGAEPTSVLYRHLAGKENAILDFDDEQRVYLALADAGIAAPVYVYEHSHRIEAFYSGRTVTRHDLKDHDILAQVGQRLAGLHGLWPHVSQTPFFDRLHEKWGRVAKRVLHLERQMFPENEQEMCEELTELLEPGVQHMVQQCMPAGPLSFCHNDTYHGNLFLLDSGELKLLDFEFSCLNHRAFDFANLFAETVTRHGLAEYPYFDIVEPEYTEDDIAAVIDAYLKAGGEGELAPLVAQTQDMIMMSDYMYAMAALPLAVNPVQKIRFIPYSLRRFNRFKDSWQQRFG